MAMRAAPLARRRSRLGPRERLDPESGVARLAPRPGERRCLGPAHCA